MHYANIFIFSWKKLLTFNKGGYIVFDGLLDSSISIWSTAKPRDTLTGVLSVITGICSLNIEETFSKSSDLHTNFYKGSELYNTLKLSSMRLLIIRWIGFQQFRSKFLFGRFITWYPIWWYHYICRRVCLSRLRGGWWSWGIDFRCCRSLCIFVQLKISMILLVMTILP